MNPDPRLVEQFTDALCEAHIAQLRSGDDELRDAIMIKMVALTALAFGMSPTRGVPLDTDDAISNLRQALAVISKNTMAAA
jgi:hypothetical protein